MLVDAISAGLRFQKKPLAQSLHNPIRMGEMLMPLFVFTVMTTPASETELQEVFAPDFTTAVQTLAARHPGIHIIKLEGIYAYTPAYA